VVQSSLGKSSKSCADPGCCEEIAVIETSNNDLEYLIWKTTDHGTIERLQFGGSFWSCQSDSNASVYSWRGGLSGCHLDRRWRGDWKEGVIERLVYKGVARKDIGAITSVAQGGTQSISGSTLLSRLFFHTVVKAIQGT
jgi:hypothetical protein